jgi:phage terminase small subunit
MPPKGKLTPKQALFVKEYVVDLNATQAAIRAGYDPTKARYTSCRLLATNVNIQAAIQKEKEKRNARVEISQDWVLKRLKIVAKRCLEEIPVTDREGNEIGSWKFEAAGANKALELLGKHLAMFTEKVESKNKSEQTTRVILEGYDPNDPAAVRRAFKEVLGVAPGSFLIGKDDPT